MPGKRKLGVVTFKAEEPLIAALEGVPNKSEFIRTAILAALDGACPLCGGNGILSKHQREHWQSFLKSHTLKRCKKCHGVTIDCSYHGAEGD